MSDKFSEQAKYDRYYASRDLYYLCKVILGYKDMVKHVHGELCEFYTSPEFGRFRQATVPRSWFKTVTMTVGGCIWMTLPDEEGLYKDIFPFKGPDARILIASNVIDNAAKMVHMIKDHWQRNDRLRAAFPDLIPDFNNVRWSDHCAELKRDIKATEGTYTAVGAGGSVISQHFDLIQEDDLIYAKKDDFTGQELMPSQEDIDNAIGWHKLAFSLLVNPKESCMFNVGTRWAPHDLVDYIRNKEKHYQCMDVSATKGAVWPVFSNDDVEWPERYDVLTLNQIRDSQGPKIFETQYLNRPRAGEDVTFNCAYLKRHLTLDEYPPNLKDRTFVDLAGWSERKGGARSVILTGAKDDRNHLWIKRVDVGRFNPSEVIELFKAHQKQFDSKVLIEEVQYQRAIRHFAKIDMESPTGHFYNLEAIPADVRKDAKDLRIQGLEPIVRNGAVHVLDSMKELVREMEDYPYSVTKDILDCMGFLQMHGPRPGIELPKEVLLPFTREAMEREFKARSSGGNEYPFSVQLRREDGSTVLIH